jgi:hypothetical protein
MEISTKQGDHQIPTIIELLTAIKNIPTEFINATKEVITALGKSVNELCKTLSGQSSREKQLQLQTSHERTLQGINTAHTEAMQQLLNNQTAHENDTRVVMEVALARERIKQAQLSLIDAIQKNVFECIRLAIENGVCIDIQFNVSETNGISLHVRTLPNPNFSLPVVNTSYQNVAFCLYWETTETHNRQLENVYITGIPSWNEEVPLQRGGGDRNNIYSYNLTCQLIVPLNCEFKYKIKYAGENDCYWLPYGDPAETNLRLAISPGQNSNYAFIAYRTSDQDSRIQVRHNAKNNSGWENADLIPHPKEKTLHTSVLIHTTKKFHFRFFRLASDLHKEQWYPRDKVQGLSLDNNLCIEASSTPSQTARLLSNG